MHLKYIWSLVGAPGYYIKIGLQTTLDLGIGITEHVVFLKKINPFWLRNA